MSNITKITDYDLVILDLMMAQYASTVKFKGIVKAANDQADDLETAAFEIRDEFYLDVAVGVQLDVIGEIFNVDREGLSDSQYRSVIQAKASLTNSGEPESIINILKALYGATVVNFIQTDIPATYYIITDATITVSELELFTPAGVEPLILTPIEYEDGSFFELETGENLYFVS